MSISAESDYQPLTAEMRRMLYVASFFVLSVGGTLYLFTSHTAVYFAWTIQSPLTAAFLGGAYWSACVLEFLAARERLWANARCAVPGMIIFTALTLVVTLLHIDKFHFHEPGWITRAGTWAWMGIYISVPVILSVLLISQVRVPGGSPAPQFPLPGWIKAAGAINGTIMISFGIALLVSPAQTALLWPWTLTELTARALGAWWIGLGALAVQEIFENDTRRARAVRMSAIVFGVLQLIALARYPHDVNWSAMNTWVYVFFIIDFLLIGIQGLMTLRSGNALK